jgi:hypothetical protein
MNDFTKHILWQQFGASIDALEAAIQICPDEFWGDPAKLSEILGDPAKLSEAWHEPWYLTYHTLFWLDFYLSNEAEGFAPPAPFGLEELDPAGVVPNRIYSKAEMLEYLHHCRWKCKATVEALTDESAQKICSFGWLSEIFFAELLLYNMRHVQHHTGQLNLILRQRIDDAPRWVRRAKP